MPVYTKDILIAYASENNVTLYDDCGNSLDSTTTFYDDIKRDKPVHYGCIKSGCTNCSSKSFRRLLDTGAFCPTHIQQTRMKKIEKKCLQETGFKNPLSNPVVRKKAEATNEERYGDKHAMKNKTVSTKMGETIRNANKGTDRQQKINDKKKQTYLETLGVEHPSKSESIKKKKEDTNLKNRGVTHPAKSKAVLDKMQSTYKERTGFDSVSSNPAVRRKAEDTNEERYGFKYPTQNAELMRKAFTNSFRMKEFVFPSGLITTCMGYEHFAIQELLKQVEEDDIYTDVKQFPYRKPNEEKDRQYTPDIYVKSLNLYIEVKSTWTITQDHENIIRKQTAVKDTGANCEIWVINEKGIIVEKYL